MIDLHTHSARSDGTQSPTELMNSARDAGLTCVGLTDHDTISGWDEAGRAVARTGVSLVRGMEVTSQFHDDGGRVSVHMLAYLFDPSAPKLSAHRQQLQERRADRARQIVDRLAQDFNLTWDAVADVAGEGAVVGRPHIADALIAAGVVASREEAFAQLLHPRGKYYVPNYSPDVFDVISWINAAGGRAVFAHPMAATRGKTVPLKALDEMAEAGLFGVEVDHRDNPLERREELRQRARSLELFQFGSSDYHGAGKPNRLGEHTTDSDTLAALEEGAFLEVIRP